MTQRITSSILFLVLSAVFLSLTWPVWSWLWGEWMNNDYYSHGSLIVAVVLFLIWKQIGAHNSDGWALTQSAVRGLLALAGSLGLYVFFLENKAYYLAAFSLIGMMGGIAWTMGGIQWLRRLAFPLSYLMLMVPLPFVERATLPLALWTGIGSSAIVRWLGMDVTVTGAAVKLPNADLVIGAQCSGINSIMALTALNVLVAYLVQGPLWGRLILALLSVPLAMLGNLLRVANLLVVARYLGAEFGFRFYHDYSGPIFFLAVLVLLIPLTRILRCRTLRFGLP